jgi:hypothetical protein
LITNLLYEISEQHTLAIIRYALKLINNNNRSAFDPKRTFQSDRSVLQSSAFTRLLRAQYKLPNTLHAVAQE